MLRLYVQAPFAAFRTFTAGWYRPTAGFLTPSAAYGLALNLAGIETRRDDGLSAMTVTRFALPPARVALGADVRNSVGPYPPVHTIFQQLHNYPVGTSGKERQEDAKGNKYNITPVRREFLSDLRAFVVLDFPQNPEVEDSIRHALDSSDTNYSPRYGLPFLGDNAFLIDKIRLHEQPVRAHWFRTVEHEENEEVARSTRLTVWIDRQDMSKTRSALFTPGSEAEDEAGNPNWPAWIQIMPPTEPIPPTKASKKKD